MDVQLDTSGREAFTVWTDQDGDLVKVIYRVRAPRDVFTNLDTGRQMLEWDFAVFCDVLAQPV